MALQVGRGLVAKPGVQLAKLLAGRPLQKSSPPRLQPFWLRPHVRGKAPRTRCAKPADHVEGRQG
eukprot:14620877-Alexandrium_andersonii.AAC.1